MMRYGFYFKFFLNSPFFVIVSTYFNLHVLFKNKETLKKESYCVIFFLFLSFFLIYSFIFLREGVFLCGDTVVATYKKLSMFIYYILHHHLVKTFHIVAEL